MSIFEKIINIDAELERTIFGYLDTYAKIIERALNVTIINRDGKIKLVGNEHSVNKAERVINNLAGTIKRGNEITEQNVTYAISLVLDDEEDDLYAFGDFSDVINLLYLAIIHHHPQVLI